ncbi:MAG: PIN domain-containing protein [Nitrospirota bacterium]|jgi:predicted nucleic acid-binding protein
MNIFIDTSAWIALENKRDIHFKEAITFKEEIRNKSYRLYTSNFVLDETYTLLLANVGYEKTIEFAKRIRGLRSKGVLHIIQVTEEIEDSAWIIFERFNKDKFWSFTDCTSKAIMELLDIKEGFTFDKDFEQMGFVKRP